jgi:hypothetical protein
MRSHVKRFAFLLLGLALLASTGCSAADHGFNSVVAGVEHRYSVHAQRIPLMGFVSFCAMLKTHGGVKGLRIAEFDNIRGMDGMDLDALLRSRLGKDWQPFVTDVEGGDRARDRSVILVRPHGSSMGMLVVDYDHGELDLVGMELNGAALAKWLYHPEEQQRSSHRGHDSTD